MSEPSSAPPRPSSVPHGADWSGKDNEWILGPKDDGGERHGEIHYFRPGGTLCCICDVEHGKPHGVGRRFHESGEVSQVARYDRGVLHGKREWHKATRGTTTEKMHGAHVSTDVARVEIEYDHGDFTSTRYFDVAGVEVDAQCAPLPARPTGVPAGAMRAKDGAWIVGRWSGDTGAVKALTRFRPDGALEIDETRSHDVVTIAHHRGPRIVRYRLRAGVLDGDVDVTRGTATMMRAQFRTGRRVYLEQLDDAGAVVRRGPAVANDAFLGADRADNDNDNNNDNDNDNDNDNGNDNDNDNDNGNDNDNDNGNGNGNDDDNDGIDIASAASLARALAIAFGGGDTRDTARARVARKIVRAQAPGSVLAKLAALGLDTAPRLLTSARMQRAAKELGDDDNVDGAVLEKALVDAGGPAAIGLALSRPASAAAFLEKRRHENGFVNLSHLGLRELPKELGALPNLRDLNASNNALVDVPRELSDAVMLRKIDLSGNRIERLPKELAWMPLLDVVHLAENALTSVPSTIFTLETLDALGLGDNQLTSLPDAVGDLTELDHLWLHGNKLTSLPRGFARLRNLSFLHLGDHLWDEPPEILGELLNLDHLWIGSPHLKRLPPFICTLPKLKQLIVWHAQLTDVPDELYDRYDLVELRIKGNPLKPGVLEKLTEALPNTRIY